MVDMLLSFCLQTRMQSLQPDPNAQYRSVYGALKRIVRTEGLLRPLRGLNITVLGAGPAHALYLPATSRSSTALVTSYRMEATVTLLTVGEGIFCKVLKGCHPTQQATQN